MPGFMCFFVVDFVFSIPPLSCMGALFDCYLTHSNYEAIVAREHILTPYWYDIHTCFRLKTHIFHPPPQE